MLWTEALLLRMIYQLAGMKAYKCLFSPPRNSRMWLLQYSYLNYCNVPTFSGCLLSITLCASKIYFVYFVFNTQNEHFFKLQKDICCISLTTAENGKNKEFWFPIPDRSVEVHVPQWTVYGKAVLFVFIFLWQISKQYVTFALL